MLAQAASSTPALSSDFLHLHDNPQRRVLSMLHLCRWKRNSAVLYVL